MGIDNMGGIVASEIIPYEQVVSFSRSAGRVSLSLSGDFMRIPQQQWGCNVKESASTTDSGTTYGYTVQIAIPGNRITASDLEAIRLAAQAGVVLKCRYAQGETRVYGGPNYPLFGYVGELHPQRPGDMRGFVLNLINVQCFPALLLGV